MTGARAALLVVVAAASLRPAQARVYLTVPQALESVFPAPAHVDRRTLYLDDGQATRAAAAAGAPVEARVIPYYVGTIDGRVVGYAYFDTHLVRTLPETVLVLLGPAGDLTRIDIVSFDEPEDYLPSARWLRQFPGRGPDQLTERQGLRAITGATLSSRAVTQAARRVLTLHRMYVAAAIPPAAAPSPSARP